MLAKQKQNGDETKESENKAMAKEYIDNSKVIERAWLSFSYNSSNSNDDNNNIIPEDAGGRDNNDDDLNFVKI